MTKINIPASIEDAKSSLNGLGSLLHAKEWERAAIVYAFTQPQPGKRTSGDMPGGLTIRAFAALGIIGLTDEHTVGDYRKAWETTGSTDVQPGDKVTLPTMPWPPGMTSVRRGSHATTAEVEAGIRKMLVEKPVEAAALVVKAAKAHPATADAVTTAIVNDADLNSTVGTKSFAKAIGVPSIKPYAPSVPAFDPNAETDAKVEAAMKVIQDALRAEAQHTWTMSGSTEFGLRLLLLQLLDRLEPAVYAQVNAHAAKDRV